MVTEFPQGQVHSQLSRPEPSHFQTASFFLPPSLSNTQLCTLVGSPSESLSLGGDPEAPDSATVSVSAYMGVWLNHTDSVRAILGPLFCPLPFLSH